MQTSLLTYRRGAEFGGPAHDLSAFQACTETLFSAGGGGKAGAKRGLAGHRGARPYHGLVSSCSTLLRLALLNLPLQGGPASLLSVSAGFELSTLGGLTLRRLTLVNGGRVGYLAELSDQLGTGLVGSFDLGSEIPKAHLGELASKPVEVLRLESQRLVCFGQTLPVLRLHLKVFGR